MDFYRYQKSGNKIITANFIGVKISAKMMIFLIRND